MYITFSSKLNDAATTLLTLNGSTILAGTYLPGLLLMSAQQYRFSPSASFSRIVAGSLASKFLTCFGYGV